MTTNRIGVCSWSLAPNDVETLAAALARVGIARCQLALGPLLDRPEAWRDTVARLRGDGIDVVSGMFAAVGEDYTTPKTIAATGGLRPDGTWPENLERAAATARLAADNGLRLVTFHAGFVPESADDPVRGVMIERLRRVIDLFAADGVAVAFETGQETAGTLVQALEVLDRPDAGVNFDPANMLLYGMGDPVDAIRLLSDRVLQVHVKDAFPPDEPGTWGREMPAGDGAVDWEAFLDEVIRLPRVVDLVIERESGPTREADIMQARELLEGRGPAFGRHSEPDPRTPGS